MCICRRSTLIQTSDSDNFRWETADRPHSSTECNPTGVDDFRVTSSFRWTMEPDTILDVNADNVDTALHGLPIRLHIQRLKDSVRTFGWTQAEKVLHSDSIELVLRQGLGAHMRPEMIWALNEHPQQLRLIKVRLSVSKEGNVELQDGGIGSMKPPIYPFSFSLSPFQPFVPHGDIRAKVVLTPMSTEPSSFTQHKTTHRSMYTQVHGSMIKGVLAPTIAEVLLHNPSDEIMEATVSTVYFRQGSKWITPARECGGNLGTTRAWALEQGWCEEGIMSVSEVKSMHGQIVWLSNAVRGFWPARLCLNQEEWEAHLQNKWSY